MEPQSEESTKSLKQFEKEDTIQRNVPPSTVKVEHLPEHRRLQSPSDTEDDFSVIEYPSKASPQLGIDRDNPNEAITVETVDKRLSATEHERKNETRNEEAKIYENRDPKHLHEAIQVTEVWPIVII